MNFSVIEGSRRLSQKTGHRKQDTENRKPNTGHWKPDTENRKPETDTGHENRKPETGHRKQDTGNRKLDTGDVKTGTQGAPVNDIRQINVRNKPEYDYFEITGRQVHAGNRSLR